MSLVSVAQQCLENELVKYREIVPFSLLIYSRSVLLSGNKIYPNENTKSRDQRHDYALYFSLQFPDTCIKQGYLLHTFLLSKKKQKTKNYSSSKT